MEIFIIKMMVKDFTKGIYFVLKGIFHILTFSFIAATYYRKYKKSDNVIICHDAGLFVLFFILFFIFLFFLIAFIIKVHLISIFLLSFIIITNLVSLIYEWYRREKVKLVGSEVLNKENIKNPDTIYGGLKGGLSIVDYKSTKTAKIIR